MSRFSVFKELFKYKNAVLNGEQEKETINRVRLGEKNPSLAIIDCHHSASLVMPIGDSRDRFFYLTLTLMIDSYIIISSHGTMSR